MGELYHRYMTGLILALVIRQGTDRAAEVVFRTFRAQHLELFLPGLAKLGLADRPPAVACAQYHVLSNALGGVGVMWIPESDTKSWVRYTPPRWIFDGTAVCGIPTEVARAMLHGWHGHNGQSLGNDRLGFVCTMQTTDGQPGLEGYYIEEDHPLDEADRVRFRPGERPPNPPADLPLPSWSAERLAKVDRNYATAYIRTMLPAMASVLGPGDAAAVGRMAARQVAMQYRDIVNTLLGHPEPADSPEVFAGRLARFLNGHGRGCAARADGPRVRLDAGHGLFPDPAPWSVFEGWNGLWEGWAEMEGHRLTVTARSDLGDPATEWMVA